MKLKDLFFLSIVKPRAAMSRLKTEQTHQVPLLIFLISGIFLGLTVYLSASSMIKIDYVYFPTIVFVAVVFSVINLYLFAAMIFLAAKMLKKTLSFLSSVFAVGVSMLVVIYGFLIALLVLYYCNMDISRSVFLVSNIIQLALLAQFVLLAFYLAELMSVSFVSSLVVLSLGSVFWFILSFVEYFVAMFGLFQYSPYIRYYVYESVSQVLSALGQHQGWFMPAK